MLFLLGLALFISTVPVPALANSILTPHQKEPELSFRAIGSDNLSFSIWAACQRVLMTHWTAYPILIPDMSNLDEPLSPDHPSTQPVLPELGEPD